MSVFDNTNEVYRAALQEGIALGKREIAAKLAEKDAAIAELVEALRPFAIQFEIADAAGELQHWSPNEVKYCEAAWRAIRKHAPILPNLHSHHDRAELLRDEYPDKYAGLKADAIRENGDTK